jgi:fibronectin type 3 domain-containing protein
MKIKHITAISIGIAISLVLPACRPKIPPHAVTLTWLGSGSDASTSGFNVYRSTTPGTGFVKIASRVSFPWYEDDRVVSGQTYFYAVTSLDLAGFESKFSSEVQATIP